MAGSVLSHENKYITLVCCPPAKINEEEAASSTKATLSSLAKNPGLHKPGPMRKGNTNSAVFMESTNVSKLNYPEENK